MEADVDALSERMDQVEDEIEQTQRLMAEMMLTLVALVTKLDEVAQYSGVPAPELPARKQLG